MKKDLGLLRSELEGLKSLKLSSYYSQLKNSQKNLDNIIKTRKRMLESHGEPLTNKIQLGGKRLTIETYQADDPVWESKDVAM